MAPWSQSALLLSAASYDGIDPSYNLAGLMMALGAANTIYGADTSMEDDGENGWMFTHSSNVCNMNHHLLLQLFAPRSDTSIRNGWCRHYHEIGVNDGQVIIFLDLRY